MSDVRIKIYGAGSAGTHLTRAALERGWLVDVVDRDPKAFIRMANLYQSRYQELLHGVNMYTPETEEPDSGGYDIIAIATPPETHLPILGNVLREAWPGVVLIEKPLCPPNQISMAERFSEMDTPPLFVGYTHLMHTDLFGAEEGKHYSLTCEFRENWKFVLKAHPWMKTEKDSYLGDWNRGGGAICEHSHGINMWQHVARECGYGEVVRVSANVVYQEGYDSFASISLQTETGFGGTVVLDTTSEPAIKKVELFGENSYHAQTFGKCDFGAELDHVYGRTTSDGSPISYERGLLTAKICRAAHESGNAIGRWIDVA